MLTLKYIQDETLWVLKLNGARLTCKGSELREKLDRYEDDLRDHDVLVWYGQPKELQEFWHSYDNAIYNFDRKDLYYIDDFYAEWIKDPHQFDPKHLPVIGTLRKELDQLNPKANLLICNYDHEVVGNHHVINFIRALELMNTDFDIVTKNLDNDNQYEMIIQDDDREKVKEFNIRSNDMALRESFA